MVVYTHALQEMNLDMIRQLCTFWFKVHISMLTFRHSERKDKPSGMMNAVCTHVCVREREITFELIYKSLLEHHDNGHI